MIVFMIVAYALFLLIEAVLFYVNSKKGKEVNAFFLPPIVGFAFIQQVVSNPEVSRSAMSILIGIYVLIYGVYWFVCITISKASKNKIF